MQQPHPLSNQNDLIDFGQNEGTTVPLQIPADLKATQTQNNGQQQKELEQVLQSTSTGHENKGSLIDFHEDLKKTIPEVRLQRQDTDTQSVDEFVDAEG
jgi:hypothetical protein